MDKKTNCNFDTEAGFVIVMGILMESSKKTGEVVIPDGVIEIGEDAFKDCTELTSVVIPESMVRIGKHAFMGCTGLMMMQGLMRSVFPSFSHLRR